MWPHMSIAGTFIILKSRTKLLCSWFREAMSSLLQRGHEASKADNICKLNRGRVAELIASLNKLKVQMSLLRLGEAKRAKPLMPRGALQRAGALNSRFCR